MQIIDTDQCFPSKSQSFAPSKCTKVWNSQGISYQIFCPVISAQPSERSRIFCTCDKEKNNRQPSSSIFEHKTSNVVCIRLRTSAHVCVRLPTFAYVCPRLRTSAHVCAHVCPSVYMCVHFYAYCVVDRMFDYHRSDRG